MIPSPVQPEANIPSDELVHFFQFDEVEMTDEMSKMSESHRAARCVLWGFL